MATSKHTCILFIKVRQDDYNDTNNGKGRVGVGINQLGTIQYRVGGTHYSIQGRVGEGMYSSTQGRV